jgi:hypothetical protein
MAAVQYGFLFLSLHPQSFWWGVAVYLVSAYLAIVDVFISDDNSILKMFLFGLAWASQTTAVAIMLPYEEWSVTDGCMLEEPDFLQLELIKRDPVQ